MPWILKRIQNGVILDVGGVGNGKVQELTHKLLKRGSIIYEIDLIEPELDHPNFHFRLGDVLVVDFTSSIFDSIVAIHVVQHIGREWRNMTEIHDKQGDYKFAERAYKWLKPNGILFVEVPVASRVHEIVWDERTSWKIFSLLELDKVFNKFTLINSLTYDGAKDSKSRVPDAKSIVLMLRKPNE